MSLGFCIKRRRRLLWRLNKLLSSCLKKNDWKIFTFIFTCITLIHVNYIVFYQFRYFLSDDFIKIFRWYHFPAPCKTSPDVLQDMIDLTSSASNALNKLAIPGAVCFGTLWGVLRQESFLPWDSNVDFCVMNEDLIREEVSFEQLFRAFESEGVTINSFDSHMGTYKITKGKAKGDINMYFDCSTYFYLTHFEYKKDNPNEQPEERHHWACPVGWAPTAARFIHNLNKPFPLWILEPPFSKGKLEGLTVDVPHDSFEIQKYLYPDDWWLEVKPPGC